MPENLYPQLPTVPPMSQGSFNIEMVRKYYQDIANIKEKYAEKQRRYKNAYNRLLHASTGGSSVALVSGVSTIATSIKVLRAVRQNNNLFSYLRDFNKPKYRL